MPPKTALPPRTLPDAVFRTVPKFLSATKILRGFFFTSEHLIDKSAVLVEHCQVLLSRLLEAIDPPWKR